MRKAVLSSASLVAVSVLALASLQPARAQEIAQAVCGLREDMGKMLAQRFGEQPKAAGLVGDRVVELLVSQTGSWTLLMTGPDGRSCVLTGGDEWTEKPIQAIKMKTKEETT